MTGNTSAIDYRRASFILSAAKRSQYPADTGAEVAFVGRSNSGKSSAINTICDQKKLARASKTPGRTQLINFFAVGEAQRLVDLPGYGFAKVPPEVRKEWGKLVESYLAQRASLAGIVLVMDIRHPLQPSDLTLVDWVAPRGTPLLALLTKSDKLKRGATAAAVLGTRKALARLPNSRVEAFSSLDGSGLAPVRAILDEWLAPASTPA